MAFTRILSSRQRGAARRSQLIPRVLAALAGLALFGTACSPNEVFVPSALTETAHDQSTTSRRGLLAVLGAASIAPVVSAANAADRPPENKYVGGRRGTHQEVNGRYTIVFGKKIAGNVVYKRDGDKIYLMTNDCGQLQLDTTPKATCDGFAVKEGNVWKFDGQPDPAVQDALTEVEKEITPDVQAIINEEKKRIDREESVKTFRGTMDDTDEASGDRLMSKMGAKIAAGM